MNTNLAYNFPLESELTEQERIEAESFGRSENLFDRIRDDYTKLGLVGESHNKILAYLASVSRKMNDPLNLLILSSSGAGKSTLQDKTLLLTPEEDVVRVSTLSDKALFYMDRYALKNRVLAIEEAAGIKDMYSIRTLITEGHLTIETVAGGKLRKNTVEGKAAVFQTTTNPDINPETKSRFFVIGVDESREQTRSILELQRRAQTLEGIIERNQRENIIRKHHNFQRLLKNYAVVNPYAESLFYGDDRLQARRDQPKFLTLCTAIAFLRQMTKEVKFYKGEIELEYIEVDPFDIKLATELASEVMGTSLDDISIPARELLLELDRMLPRGRERYQRTFTRQDIISFTGWTRTRLHIHLQELIEMELVLKVSGGTNSLQNYQLLFQGETERKFLLGLTTPASTESPVQEKPKI